MWHDVQTGKTAALEAFIARTPAKAVVHAGAAQHSDSEDDDDDSDSENDMMAVEHSVGGLAMAGGEGGADGDGGWATTDSEGEEKPPKVDADGWETVSPKKTKGKKK